MNAYVHCRPTWYLNPLVCITNCPHIHHHVHPTSRKVLAIRGPGQGHWFCMMSVILSFALVEKTKSEK